MPPAPLRPMDAENYDDRFTVACRTGSLVYDSRDGVGAHSENADIRHFGFGALITTNSFLTAAARLEPGERRIRSLDYLPSTQPSPGWAPPRLDLDRIPPTRVGGKIVKFVVVGHEGRHRTLTAQKLGCGVTPVHVIVRNQRARHLTIADIESMTEGVIIEDGGRYSLNDPYLHLFITKLRFKTVFLDGQRYDYESP